MKSLICELCIKSSVLCSGCEEKLKKGIISELDVLISRALYNLSEKFNHKSVTFIKGVDLGRVILILVKGDISVLIGREGRIVTELSKLLGKKVRIAEVSGDIKKTISDIVMPVKLIGINTIFRKGEITYKVRLYKGDIKHIPIDINTLEKALFSLMNGKADVVFE